MSTETDPTAFSEILRKSYSHGLEEIYALQDVDIKTVRQIEIPVNAGKDKNGPTATIRASGPAQISLPLKGGHRCAMASFILQEPIQVIGLPANLEAYLHGKGIATIASLLKEDLTAHKDIRAKTEEYIDSRPLDECDRINFGAWLRSVIGPVPPLKAHIALEPYGLEALYPLSPQQKVEWRRLDDTRKSDQAKQTWDQWRSQAVLTRFYESLKEITDAYLRPWIRQRQGLAVAYELYERLERVSENSAVAHGVIRCFEQNFCSGTFILEKHLCHADKGLYADTLETAQIYDQLIEHVMSYFYKEELVYDFHQLIDYVMRELVRRWDHFELSFVTKALRLSPQFRVRKGNNQKLQIWLA